MGVETNTTNISRNASNISRNTSNIVRNTSGILLNQANIGINTNEIALNRSNISSNTSAISNNLNAINNLDGEFQSFAREASAGIAGASSFVDTSSGGAGSTFALGAASYNSEQAVSANYGYTPKTDSNWDLFAGVALNSSGSDIYRAGFRYRWGKNNNHSPLGASTFSKRKLSKLQNSVNKYQSIVEAQAKQIEVLAAQNKEIMSQLNKVLSLVSQQNSFDDNSEENLLAVLPK